MKVPMLPGVAVVLLVSAGGCATDRDVPLVFGSSNSLGIYIGASVPEQGGDFTIGYKARDFAVMPVTLVNADGTESLVGSQFNNGKAGDSFSVLGQFKSEASRTSTGAKTGLGKFFSTGMAASTLAQGFAERLGVNRTSTSGCNLSDSKPAAKPPAQDAVANLGAVMDKHEAADHLRHAELMNRLGSHVDSVKSPGGPSKPPRAGHLMFFGQYIGLGFTIGATTVDQGFDLNLGYKDRNLAIVPVIYRDSTGKGYMIRSNVGSRQLDGAEPSDLDAFSVLGQFEFDSDQDAATVRAGLGKFFSTGNASQRLANGFRTHLCEQYTAPVSK